MEKYINELVLIITGLIIRYFEKRKLKKNLKNDNK